MVVKFAGIKFIMESPSKFRASAIEPVPKATKAIINTMNIVPLFLGFKFNHPTLYKKLMESSYIE
jgi:hypothetical protein